MDSAPGELTPARLALGAISLCLHRGWLTFRRTQAISLAYAGLFAALGFILLTGAAFLGFTPMVVPLAGAFMLIAPVLLCSFFRVADCLEQGESPRFTHFFEGFRSSPPRLWVLALVCMFLFLVWLTDAATVYSLYFGTTPTFPVTRFIAALFSEWSLQSFLLFTSLMGAAIAFAIFVVSAFAVPLLFYRRSDLPGAVGASVRGVFANFLVTMAWALLLTIGIFASLLVFPPAFAVVFPVLAYAGRALYRLVYPG